MSTQYVTSAIELVLRPCHLCGSSMIPRSFARISYTDLSLFRFFFIIRYEDNFVSKKVNHSEIPYEMDVLNKLVKNLKTSAKFQETGNEYEKRIVNDWCWSSILQ